MNVYEHCPTFENERWRIRPIEPTDAAGLAAVYCDPAALFNGDNCNGDDFHYATLERMEQAVAFWVEALPQGYFVRQTLVDKRTGTLAGTMEAFLRTADDALTDTVLLRLDVGSAWENAEDLGGILALWMPKARAVFGGKQVATKVFAEASARRTALTAAGFGAADQVLIGKDGTAYGGYAVCPLTGFAAVEADELPRAVALLSRAPELNLFMLGDLTNYGVSCGKTDLFALPDAAGEWSALLLRYETYWNLYCPAKKPDARAVTDFLAGWTVDSFSGEKTDMEHLLAEAPSFFAGKRVEKTKLCCRRGEDDACAPLPPQTEVRFLTAEEAEQSEELLQGISEFFDHYETPEETARSLRIAQENVAKGELLCGLYADDELASVASTTASTADSAMIVGVATRKEKRGRGYATAVMNALCAKAFEQGKKSLCLFYDNEAAGRIYRGMGFEYVGEYWLVD